MSMKNLNLLVKGMVSLLLGGLLVTSCQSEDFDGPVQAKGKGTVTLNLKMDSSFGTSTKAISEADSLKYHGKNNYTVEILKANEDESVVVSELYPNLEDSYTLDLGSYIARAYYGENYKDVKATQDGYYVVGEQTFTMDVNEDNEVESKSISLTCSPTHAKLIANFDVEEMDKYFSDYYVTYKVGTTETSKVNNMDPWYLLVNKAGETVTATIHLTLADGDSYTVNKDFVSTKTKTLKPNESWTLEIAPTYEQKTGDLGINITIDETTEDHEIVITVPSDWV